MPKRTFYLHLKETEFRFNHWNNNLYKELLNFLRKDPLRALCFLSPKPIVEGVTQPQQRLLDALTTLESLGLHEFHKTQLAAIAGVSPSSGSFANNLGRLRTMGLIDYPRGGYVALSKEGRRAARPPTATLTLNDLHQAWLGIVTDPQRKILQEVIAAYPGDLPKADLAAPIGVSAGSGAFANNLGRLRTLCAIDYPRPGSVRAEAVLFPRPPPSFSSALRVTIPHAKEEKRLMVECSSRRQGPQDGNVDVHANGLHHRSGNGSRRNPSKSNPSFL